MTEIYLLAIGNGKIIQKGQKGDKLILIKLRLLRREARKLENSNLNIEPKFHRFHNRTPLLFWRLKFGLLIKILIFGEKFDFWRKFVFLAKICIFGENFDFC